MTMLAAIERRGSGPTVVLLHGITQTRRLWGGLDDALASDHEVVAVDLPGHGDAAPVGASVEQTADELADRIGPAWWVGYSMGGRHALHVAARRPEAVEGLVLIGATAGLSDAAERAERLAADTTRATRIIVDGVAAFVDDWLAQPLFADLPPQAADVEERYRSSVEGLASSFVLAGTGAQGSLWGELGTVTCPTRLVVGERDDKFRAIADRLSAELGGATAIEVVEGAGHAAHLEQPSEVAEIIRTAVASS